MGAGGEARGRRRWFGSCDLVDDEEGGLERRGDASAPSSEICSKKDKLMAAALLHTKIFICC